MSYSEIIFTTRGAQPKGQEEQNMSEREYIEFLIKSVTDFSNEIIDKTDLYTLSGQVVVNTLKPFRRYVISLLEKRLEQL